MNINKRRKLQLELLQGVCMYKIIIVEDEEMIRKGLEFSTNFEALDCIVVGNAANGEEGIQKIHELSPNIVITDINMPLKTGIDMLKETRECEYSAIVISGYDEFAYAKEAMKFGVTEYLLKPIDPVELEEAIQHAKQQYDMINEYNNVKKQKEKLSNSMIIIDKKVNDETVNEMINYIHMNYMRKFVMADLAKELSYSEALLNRKFKNYTSYTFNDYLNRYRIQKAVEFIKSKQYYLYDISTMCGFSEYKYFSSVFKKYIGCSPNDFLEILNDVKRMKSRS